MNNNHLYFLLTGLIVTISIPVMMEYSYAQTTDANTQISFEYGTFIFVQTFLENSNGQVIAYLTSDKFTDLDSPELDKLLDSEVSASDPIITINDQKFQLIKRKLVITYDKENVIASTILARTSEDTLNLVARFAHDGYPIVSGDKVHSIWTFLRPISG